MAEHGLVTGTLNRIGRMLNRNRPRVEPPVISAAHRANWPPSPPSSLLGYARDHES
jgi:hypothetical protein